jgi:hypothetical protein
VDELKYRHRKAIFHLELGKQSTMVATVKNHSGILNQNKDFPGAVGRDRSQYSLLPLNSYVLYFTHILFKNMILPGTCGSLP